MKLTETKLYSVTQVIDQKENSYIEHQRIGETDENHMLDPLKCWCHQRIYRVRTKGRQQCRGDETREGVLENFRQLGKVPNLCS